MKKNPTHESISLGLNIPQPWEFAAQWYKNLLQKQRMLLSEL